MKYSTQLFIYVAASVGALGYFIQHEFGWVPWGFFFLLCCYMGHVLAHGLGDE